MKPGFLWWDRGFKALFCKPAGTRDFTHEPSEEEISEVEKRLEAEGTSRRHQRIFEEITRCFKSLHKLLSWWKGERRDLTINQLDYCLYECTNSQLVKDFLIDYEISFVKPTATQGVGISSKRTVVQSFNDLWVAARLQHRKIEHTKGICERISYFSMLLCGTFYIAARVIIVVLLFTSLREVPLGVYQETPWTRYLPNFS